MGFFSKLRGGAGQPSQSSQKTQFSTGGMARPVGGPPPIPGQPRKKPSGPPPAIPSTSQADQNKKATELKIMGERMAGDQHRTNGAHASADYRYRRADEMESRLKQGAPQLDDKAMSQIRPSQHMRDNPGSGWGRY